MAPNGFPTAFEIKLIGLEDADFGMVLQSIAGAPAGTCVSPYTAINYLLFRTYEAAKQLGTISSLKAVILIIDDVTWWRFELQLRKNWIDWGYAAVRQP